MSLVKREPSPARAAASRANSRLSTGPRTARGTAVARRNGRLRRSYSAVAALNVAALGEDPRDFAAMQQDLTAAMRPRDEWERAWIQDIAMLRWRLGRLQRAEAGALALRRRELARQRQREALPTEGLESAKARLQVSIAGLTSLPESPWKFEQVISALAELRDIVRAGYLNDDGLAYFDLLYGKNPGAEGVMMRTRYATLSKQYQKDKSEASEPERITLLKAVNQEIDNYERRRALYAAEHQEEDPIRQDAGLMLSEDEMDKIIRYETHLENQIERKLRQFYARRRESTLAEPEPVAAGNTEAHKLTGQAAGA